MTSNARLLFVLLLLAATAVLGTLLFALSFWSTGTHWLMWCLTTLMHFQLAVWHTAGMLLALLLGVTVLRIAIFMATSLLRKHQRALAHQTNGSAWPKKLTRAVHLSGATAVQLIESPRDDLYCFGWLKPTIIVSQPMINKLSLSELVAAMRHEEYHRQHRHAFKLLLAEMVGQILWFLPVTTDVLTYLRYRTEISADEFASGEGYRTDLRNALRKLLHMPAPAWQTAFASSPAEARINALITQKIALFHPTAARTIQSLSVLAIVGSAVVLLAAPAQASAVATLLQGAMTEHNNHCPQSRLFTPVDME